MSVTDMMWQVWREKPKNPKGELRGRHALLVNKTRSQWLWPGKPHLRDLSVQKQSHVGKDQLWLLLNTAPLLALQPWTQPLWDSLHHFIKAVVRNWKHPTLHPLGYLWQVLEMFLSDWHLCEERPAMLLNPIQFTGQPPTTKIDQMKNSGPKRQQCRH